MVLINTAPKHKALNPIDQGPEFRASSASHASPSINRHRDIAEDVPQQWLQPCLLCVPDLSELKLPQGNTNPDSAPHELIRAASVQHLKPKTSTEQTSLTWSRHLQSVGMSQKRLSRVSCRQEDPAPPGAHNVENSHTRTRNHHWIPKLEQVSCDSSSASWELSWLSSGIGVQPTA